MTDYKRDVNHSLINKMPQNFIDKCIEQYADFSEEEKSLMSKDEYLTTIARFTLGKKSTNEGIAGIALIAGAITLGACIYAWGFFYGVIIGFLIGGIITTIIASAGETNAENLSVEFEDHLNEILEERRILQNRRNAAAAAKPFMPRSKVQPLQPDQPLNDVFDVPPQRD